MNEENIIILNSEEFSLINEIEYLKDIGFENFSIDARWKEMDYIKEIGMIYRKSIDEGLDMEISKEIIGKYCDKTSDGNFNTGLK